jgi:hypothetical protein
VSSVALGFGSAMYSEAGREPSIVTIGGGAVDSVVASICGGVADSTAMVRQTRWQNPLATVATHYDLLGRS